MSKEKTMRKVSKVTKFVLFALLMILAEKLCYDTSTCNASGLSQEEIIKKISDLPREKQNSILNSLEDKNSIDIQESQRYIDELEEMEKLMNMSDEELKNECSLAESDIKKLRRKINEMLSYTDDELRQKYNYSQAEICIYRHIITKIKKYKQQKKIDSDKEVTLSSSIGKSEIDFKQIVVHDNTKSRPTYNVTESFKWKKGYYNWSVGFEDAIGVAWSGGFTVKYGDNKVQYYEQKGNYINGWTWGKNKGNKKGYVGNSVPSKGFVYFFDQQYKPNIVSILARNGHIDFVLTSKYSKKKNCSAQLISRYGHKGLGVKSVTIGSGVSVNFGGAYACTNEKDTSTTLKY